VVEAGVLDHVRKPRKVKDGSPSTDEATALATGGGDEDGDDADEELIEAIAEAWL